MPRTSSRISASASRACSWPRRMSCFAAAGIAIDALARKPEVDRQHHQSLLRAVVEVALDAVQLARLDIEDRGPALRERLDLRAAARGSRTCTGDRPPPPRWSAMTSCDSDAATGSRRAQQRAEDDQPGRVRAATERSGAPRRHGVVPERHRQQPQRDRPGDADHDELDDRQREVDRDVEDVAPAALVGELGPQRSRRCRPGAACTGGPAAARARRANTRQRSIRATTPRAFDRHRDEQDADAGEERRQAGRDEGEDDAEGERRRRIGRGRWRRPRTRSADGSARAGTPAAGNARIPGRANDAPPGIRAEPSPARMSSSPVARTTASITPQARAARAPRRSTGSHAAGSPRRGGRRSRR